MNTSTRNLLSLALATALASSAALANPPAGAGNGNAGSGNAGGNSAYTPAATSTMPTQSNAHAADAMGSPTANTHASTHATAMSDNANGTHDNMKDEAQYPPGKGNWWKTADANGDGLITSTEAAGNPFLSANFAAIDSNGDGLVSQEEYRTYYTNTASQGHH